MRQRFRRRRRAASRRSANSCGRGPQEDAGVALGTGREGPKMRLVDAAQHRYQTARQVVRALAGLWNRTGCLQLPVWRCCPLMNWCACWSRPCLAAGRGLVARPLLARLAWLCCWSQRLHRLAATRPPGSASAHGEPPASRRRSGSSRVGGMWTRTRLAAAAWRSGTEDYHAG